MFLRCVGTTLATWHNPKYIIVIEWDVPLYVTRRVFYHIHLYPVQWCLMHRINVTMPTGWTMIFNRTTHQRHQRNGSIRGRHKFLTDTQCILVQAKLHRVISRFIHYLIEKNSRLRARFPNPTGWILKVTFFCPDNPLPFNQSLNPRRRWSSCSGGMTCGKIM